MKPDSRGNAIRRDLILHGHPFVTDSFSEPEPWPAAIFSKSALIRASSVSTVLSAGARLSKLNLMLSSTVFVEPGFRFGIPVDASAACAVASRCDCNTIFAAASSRSARFPKSVVPVWHAGPQPRPCTSGTPGRLSRCRFCGGRPRAVDLARCAA